jgi:4-amino-4-deoxy-L-arabinose transferase-like glycosyltransferase
MVAATGKPEMRLRALTTLVPYALALFFALWGLRGLASHTPVDTDAARHAMNGVFLGDFLRHGNLLHPVAFARSYYSRYPALSMPYHPPLFPAFEALFFLGFGVNLLSARLAVAVTTGISAVLMYKLVLKTHHSQAIAAVSTVVFFALPSSLVLSTDVMLEMPALALVLLAMLWLPGFEGNFGVRRGIAFALIAAAAVWTKQNTVFLGLVPFVYAAVEGRWRSLRSAGLWIPAAVYGFLAGSLALIAAAFGVAGNSKWPRFDALRVLQHNVPYYAGVVRQEFGILPAVLVLIAIIFLFRQNTLYAAWTACVFLVALFMPPYDLRYVFFAYPAMVVAGCSVLFRGARMAFPQRAAWIVPAATAAVWFLAHVAERPVFLHGPFEAASMIAGSQPVRILYCGRSNGSFTFAVRSLDPALRMAVIRGDKLAREIFAPRELQRFAHDYGIGYLVLEHTEIPRAWDHFFYDMPQCFVFVGDLPIESSDHWMNGRLRVFRFRNPSAKPARTLRLQALGVPIDAVLPPEPAE